MRITRLNLKTNKNKLRKKKSFSQHKSSVSDKTTLITNEFRNSIIFLHLYLRGSLLKLIAISRNHILKKFNIHNKKAERVLEHRFRMRPSKFRIHAGYLFVHYQRIQNGLVEVFSVRNMQRLGQFSPFTVGMLMGLGFTDQRQQLMSSQESPVSRLSAVPGSVYCFDSQGGFVEFDWEQGRRLNGFQFGSRVLDCCQNKHGLFVLTEDMKIFQQVGGARARRGSFRFQIIANFDSELTQDRQFTQMRSYLEDFLLINIGHFFVLFGICEAKANMIDLGSVVRDFCISEFLHQAVVIVENHVVVISLDQNRILRKIDNSTGLRSLAVLNDFVAFGGVNKKVLHFKLKKQMK